MAQSQAIDAEDVTTSTERSSKSVPRVARWDRNKVDEAYRLFLAGLSLRAIEQKLGIPTRTMQLWSSRGKWTAARRAGMETSPAVAAGTEIDWVKEGVAWRSRMLSFWKRLMHVVEVKTGIIERDAVGADPADVDTLSKTGRTIDESARRSLELDATGGATNWNVHIKGNAQITANSTTPAAGGSAATPDDLDAVPRCAQQGALPPPSTPSKGS